MKRKGYNKFFFKDDKMENNDFWFPGRWIGGISMILAPIVLLTGELLRIQFYFSFPRLDTYHYRRNHDTLFSWTRGINNSNQHGKSLFS